MLDDAWLRALDVPPPGSVTLAEEGFHVALGVKPAFGFGFTIWLIGHADRDGEVGIAQRNDAALLEALARVARGESDAAPARGGTREVATLPLRVARGVSLLLDEAGVFHRPEKPLTGNDGLTMTLAVYAPGRGVHRFTAWNPGGRSLDLLRVLLECARNELASPWAMAALNTAREQVLGLLRDEGAEPDSSALPDRADFPGPIVLRRAGASFTLRVEDDGGVVVEPGSHGAARATRQLHPALRRRLASALDVERLAGLGAEVGFGADRFELALGTTALSIRCDASADEVDFERWRGVAQSVRLPLGLLWDLAQAALAPEATWRERQDRWIDRLPVPIHTPGLVVRFRTIEPRVHAPGESRWWSLFDHGVCLAFHGAQRDVRGRPGAPRPVAPGVVAAVRALVSQLVLPRGVDARTGDDSDRDITLLVQRPDGAGGLALGEFAWSATVAGERLIATRYARGEFDVVYSLYKLLVPLRTG